MRQQRGEKPGLLVVDDEPVVRHLVQISLERDGFKVWKAGSGREALDLFRAHAAEISVVLLDVRMPGLDGPGTLDALRELDAEVPACFMSDEPGVYERAELLNRGAAHVIAKPFDLGQLTRILRLLVGSVPVASFRSTEEAN